MLNKNDKNGCCSCPDCRSDNCPAADADNCVQSVTDAKAEAGRINIASFTMRALRLVERLDAHCRDRGLQAYLHESHTCNPDYDSDVYLLMGEAFEVMRLRNFALEHGLLNAIVEGGK